MLDFTGKVVLVTGVGCIDKGWGNGRAIATLFARQGAIVFGCDLNIETAKETQNMMAEEGLKLEIIECDVTNPESVTNMVKECITKFKRIDVLVNNVGRSWPGGPADLTEEQWDSQMDVNLKSVYVCCHEVLPIMEKQGKGAVVNISSVAGLRYIGKPQIAYAATKAAIIQFTKVTAVIYAEKGVRLNTVVPGLMHTPLVRYLADK